MGVNLSIYFSGGKEWSEWDTARYAGDREFAAHEGLPSETIVLSWYGEYPEEVAFRPQDFDSWRKRFCEGDCPNVERFTALLDFLESNPGSYVYAGW